MPDIPSHMMKSFLKDMINLVEHSEAPIDWSDVSAVLDHPGKLAIGMAEAAGGDRAAVAAQEAQNSLMLDVPEASPINAMLVMVTSSTTSYAELQRVIRIAGKSSNKKTLTIAGTAVCEELASNIRVTLLAVFGGKD